jgi:superfamily II DNA helicase RecQ
MLWTDKAKKILKKHFKFNDLKDKQIEVINSFLNGYDVIGLLPTGYGKSMTYILPPLLTKKTMFIICPLISLMEDQKDNLEKVGINVSTLHCNNVNKQEEIFKIIDGDIKIVYMSPEFLVEGDGLEHVVEDARCCVEVVSRCREGPHVHAGILDDAKLIEHE